MRDARLIQQLARQAERWCRQPVEGSAQARKGRLPDVHVIPTGSHLTENGLQGLLKPRPRPPAPRWC